jgi:anti-sigma regulatory factor (Ser/Thr protein kinase)
VVDRHGAHYLDAPLGPPVGVDASWSYASITRVLPAGTTLLAYTDGLVERRREHLDIGLERLRAAALADLPLADLVGHLVDTLVVGGDDDVALLGLHWTGAGTAPAPPADDPDTRSIELDSEPGAARAARGFVRGTLHGWGVDDAEEIAQLLTDELVSNVVCHVGSTMAVRARRGASSIRIEVEDTSTELPVRREPDGFDEHGRGVLLVERLASDWGVDVHADGKTIWFELPAAPEGVRR